MCMCECVHTHVQFFVCTHMCSSLYSLSYTSLSSPLPICCQTSSINFPAYPPSGLCHSWLYTINKLSANCPFFCYIFQLLPIQKGEQASNQCWEGALPPHSWVFLAKQCLAYVDKSYSIRPANETVAYFLPFQTKMSFRQSPLPPPNKNLCYTAKYSM